MVKMISEMGQFSGSFHGGFLDAGLDMTKQRKELFYAGER